MEKAPKPEELEKLIKFNRANIDDIAPELKLALGECILYWAQTEAALSFLFASLVNNNLWIGNDIWDSIVNFQAKLSATDKLVRRSDNEDFIAVWPTLETKLRKLSLKRAEIAHSGLAEIKRGDFFLIPHFSMGKVQERSPHRYKTSNLRELSTKFRSAKFALEWMYLTQYREKGIVEVCHMRPPELIRQIAQDRNHTLATPPPDARSFQE